MSKLIAFLAMLVLLLQASSGALARRRHDHHDPHPCRDAGSLLRRRDDHRCSSPAVSPHGGGGTRAVMTVNGFRKGEDGGGPSECDGRFHDDGEMVVALSTGWYAGGRRCHRPIRITSARTGRSVL
nr:unnamed protein product [Digitaria exilis]